MAGKSGQPKITKPLFKKHLPNSSCSYTQLSALLGVHRYTLREWLKKHSDMQELFIQQQQFMIQESEDVLFESIVNKRDAKWASWYLKVMTDKYKEKQDVNISGDLDLKIVIEDIKKEEDNNE